MELIVAIALFAIFSMAIIVGINPLEQYRKSLDSRRKNDLAQLARAVELYYADHEQYPQMSNFQIVDDATGQPIPWGNEWQPYIDLLPKDPSAGKRYLYQVSGDRQSFWLFTSLDRKNDPDRCKEPFNLNACAFANAYCSSNNSNPGNLYSCDYGKSSPNTTPEN